MLRQTNRAGLILSVVLAATASACGDSGQSGSESTSTEVPIVTEAPTVTQPPTLADSAIIWCDDNRWRVAARATQLGLPAPLETNPPSEVFYAEVGASTQGINDDVNSGLMTPESALSALGSLMVELEDGERLYVSGEWHRTGVFDDAWAAYQADEPNAYGRGCQAAFDLRDEG